MLDYLLKINFTASTPIPTQLATVKCYERHLRGRHESHIAPNVIDKLSEIIESDDLDEKVKLAASLAIARPIGGAKFIGRVSKTARRTAAFTIADYPAKITKHMGQVSISASWLSVAALILARSDEKKIKTEFRNIFCKYRESNYDPEDSFPYMIDQWAQCFTAESIDSGEALPLLAEVRDNIKTVVETMTHFASYGLKRSTGTLCSGYMT